MHDRQVLDTLIYFFDMILLISGPLCERHNFSVLQFFEICHHINENKFLCDDHGREKSL